jgi:hypothetical protein
VVRFGRIVQLIRNAPQMVFHLTEFFEDEPCGFTIQVNFFAFTIYLEKKLNKKNHSWRLELKEWLILVDTQASAIKKSVKWVYHFFNTLKIVLTEWYSKWSMHILSLISFILFSCVLLEKHINKKKQQFLIFIFCGVLY